jgi:hypothetical protein
MEPMPAVLATAGASKKPAPLTNAEKGWAGSLFVAGLLLLLGVIVWFGLSTGDWKLVSKTTSGTGASARTTEFSAATTLAGISEAQLTDVAHSSADRVIDAAGVGDD